MDTSCFVRQIILAVPTAGVFLLSMGVQNAILEEHLCSMTSQFINLVHYERSIYIYVSSAPALILLSFYSMWVLQSWGLLC